MLSIINVSALTPYNKVNSCDVLFGVGNYLAGMGHMSQGGEARRAYWKFLSRASFLDINISTVIGFT